MHFQVEAGAGKGCSFLNVRARNQCFTQTPFQANFKAFNLPQVKNAPPIGSSALTDGAFPMEERSKGAFLLQTRGMWALAVNDKLNQSEYAIYLITAGDY